MNLSEVTLGERNMFIKHVDKVKAMFKPKMKELRNKKTYSGLYLIGICEAPYEEMNFAIGTERDYERMSAKNEYKIMIGGKIR